MASVHKSGKKWRVQIRKYDHNITRSFTKKSDATKWAVAEESKLELLRNRPEEVLKSITLADLLKRYLMKVTPTKRGSTIKRETTRINRLLREPLVLTTLDKLTAGKIAQYRDMRMKKIMEGSCRHDLCLISSAIDCARKEWDIPIIINPVSMIKKPRSPKARDRRLSPDEWQALLKAARQSYYPCFTDVLTFAAETAMRRSEITRIMKTDVDIQKGFLHIPETKNGPPRTIPLSPEALNIVKRYMNHDGDTLFPLNYNQLGRAFRAACCDSELVDYRFHDVRHEAISRLTEKGLSPIEVSLISGHRDLRVLMNYSHMRVEEVGRKL
ncbi:integrase [Terasakiella pusilla]|uniref:integrase n=1 Tax=Terasakiella pusilla TaxID=64973 RepID=UPI00048EDC75|nr:site-specific integrase [Terasakiella pusilla]